MSTDNRPIACMNDVPTDPDQSTVTPSGLSTSLGHGLRRAFGWSASGNYLYAAAQFGALWVITASGPPADTATFLLSLAITSPIFLTLGLSLRSVLASESGDGFSARAYVQARLLTTAVSLALALAIAASGLLADGVSMAVGLMAVARATSEMAVLAQGVYLYAERHKYFATSQAGQAILGYGSFSVVYAATGNIDAAIVALGIGWLVSLLVIDSILLVRVASAIRSLDGSDSVVGLILKAFPLGVERGAAAFASYLPLIVLDLTDASLSAVAAFGVVTQTVRVLQVLARSTSFALIPTLSKLFARRDLATFWSILARVAAVTAGIGLAGLVAAYLVGDWLVTVIFGSEYLIDGLIEVVALNGAAVLFLALAAAGLISTRRFVTVLGVRLVAIAGISVMLVVLTPPWEAIGAGLAATIGNATAAVWGVWRLRLIPRRPVA